MIEETVLSYLGEELSVPVYMEMPEANAELTEFVLIERVGLREVGKGRIASMAFQSYGSSLYEAAKLDQEVRSAVENIVALESIAGSHLQSSYNFTDTRTGRYRYQSVFDLSYMEE